MSDADLPLLHRWLNEPGVIQWWEGDDVTWQGVVGGYGCTCTDPVEHWLASRDGAEVGWIQCYASADDPDEARKWRELGVDPGAAGIDYLVGDADARGQGLGSAMLRAFVDEVVFELHPEWSQACAAPLQANVASWRALENAGFKFAGLIGEKEVPCRLMVADRPV